MREELIEYGEVSGELCANCRNCSDYELSLDYNYTKILFVSFFERKRRYFLRCKNCRVYSQIAAPKAQYLIDSKFSEFESRRKRKRLLGNFFAFIIMSAAALGIAALIMSDGTIRYKNLIANKPDGYYEIYDKDGYFLAAITKEGEPRFDVYVKRETLDADDYSNLSDDLYFEYYYSDQEDGLKYIEENAAVLRDKLGVTVRYFYYDPEEDDIFYYFGVDDLDRISYSGNRGVYLMTFYSDTNEHYTKVYERNDKYETVLLFGDTLERLDVYTWGDGRVALYESYYAAEGEDMSPQLQTIGKDSRIDDILAVLKNSGIQPAYSGAYTYYKDSGVVESVFIRSTDPTTGMQARNTVEYMVEEKDGCYIVAPDADKPGERVVLAACAGMHTMEVLLWKA